MLGKILISSALIISLMFVASQIENSKSTIKEAKEIQEHYEIVKEIKTMIAQRYNIDPENITRDDIIAHLPKGENWEKILLLDRQKDSKLGDEDKELVNGEANIVISEDEKIKVLALKAKLKSALDTSGTNLEKDKITGKLEIPVAIEKKALFNQSIDFKNRVDTALSYLTNEILYSSEKSIDSLLSEILEGSRFFDFSLKYTEKESETIDDKKAFIKSAIKKELEKRDNSQRAQLYEKLENKIENW